MSYTLFVLVCIALLSGITGLIVNNLYRSERKALSFKILLSVALLVFSLVVGEILLYSFGKPFRVENPTFVWAGNWRSSIHPNLPYLRKPHFHWEGKSHGDLAQLNFDRDPYAKNVEYRSDKDGFRNHRQIDQADIIVLGDSYSEAINVPEAAGYVYRLGEKLAMSTKNLAVAGYTTPHESVILGEYGLPMNPKLVILQIAESNDLAENEIYYDWVKGGKKPKQFETLTLDKKESWKMRSPSYRLFQLLFPLTLNPYKLQGIQTDAQGNEWLTRFLQAPNEGMKPKEKIGWDVMKGALLRMSELCQEKGIPLLVILIPDKINVLRDVVKFEAEAQKLLATKPPIEQQESLAYFLGAYCQTLGIHFLDMTPDLKEAAHEGQVVYYPMDTHLSPEGHEVIANTLAKELIPYFQSQQGATNQEDEGK